MALPGVRTPLTPAQRQRLAAKGAEPSLHDRASLYVLMAEALLRGGTAADVSQAREVRECAAAPAAVMLWR
jgi:tetratricopeptide repeat protein 21B